MREECRTAVIGLGNPLMGDDGAGHYVVDLLRSQATDDTELVCLATPHFSLLTYFPGRGRVFLIDAADFGASPGQVRRAAPDQLRSNSSSDGLSLHDCDLLSVLEQARVLGVLPGEVIFYLIQYAAVQPVEGLCPEVRDGARKVAKMVARELGHA